MRETLFSKNFLLLHADINDFRFLHFFVGFRFKNILIVSICDKYQQLCDINLKTCIDIKISLVGHGRQATPNFTDESIRGSIQLELQKS